MLYQTKITATYFVTGEVIENGKEKRRFNTYAHFPERINCSNQIDNLTNQLRKQFDGLVNIDGWGESKITTRREWLPGVKKFFKKKPHGITGSNRPLDHLQSKDQHSEVQPNK